MATATSSFSPEATKDRTSDEPSPAVRFVTAVPVYGWIYELRSNTRRVTALMTDGVCGKNSSDLCPVIGGWKPLIESYVTSQSFYGPNEYRSDQCTNLVSSKSVCIIATWPLNFRESYDLPDWGKSDHSLSSSYCSTPNFDDERGGEITGKKAPFWTNRVESHQWADLPTVLMRTSHKRVENRGRILRTQNLSSLASELFAPKWRESLNHGEQSQEADPLFPSANCWENQHRTELPVRTSNYNTVIE